MGRDMADNWRISTFNGALLAAYFIPAWTITALKIAASPIHGLYQRPNISLALFVSDHLRLSVIATARLAWLLALGRITVVAFLAVFLFMATRAACRRVGDCDEPLGIALVLGSVLSFGGVILASQTGEVAALRLHAAELMMLLGTGIVMLLERPVPQTEMPDRLSLQQA